MRRSVPVEIEDDLFEMANLFPVTTGLPMTMWVSPRGNARHDLRVKVHMAHGNQMHRRIPPSLPFDLRRA